MKKYTLRLYCILCGLILITACVQELIPRSFQGPPLHGLNSYSGEMRQSELLGNEASGSSAKVFVLDGKLRYEMHGASPLEQLVLLAELNSGKAFLLNPTGKRYLEGAFTPQHWVYLEHLMEAFPQVMRPRLISSDEEHIGTANIANHQTVQIRNVRKENLLDNDRTITRMFWLTEEFCVPMRQEDSVTRRDFTNISTEPLAPSLFMLPTEYRKASDFAELLK